MQAETPMARWQRLSNHINKIQKSKAYVTMFFKSNLWNTKLHTWNVSNIYKSLLGMHFVSSQTMSNLHHQNGTNSVPKPFGLDFGTSVVLSAMAVKSVNAISQRPALPQPFMAQLYATGDFQIFLPRFFFNGKLVATYRVVFLVFCCPFVVHSFQGLARLESKTLDKNTLLYTFFSEIVVSFHQVGMNLLKGWFSKCWGWQHSFNGKAKKNQLHCSEIDKCIQMWPT